MRNSEKIIINAAVTLIIIVILAYIETRMFCHFTGWKLTKTLYAEIFALTGLFRLNIYRLREEQPFETITYEDVKNCIDEGYYKE